MEEKEYIKSKINRDGNLPTIKPDDLISRTFLGDPSSDGTRLQAKIVDMIKLDDEEQTNDSIFIKFCFTVNECKFKDIVTYSKIINHIENKLFASLSE